MKTSIRFPELEESLQAQLDAAAQKVRHDAAADGSKNLPAQDEDLEFYFEQHHHGYNKLISLIYSTLQIGSKCIAVLESKHLYTETRNNLATTKRLSKEQLIDVEQALKGSPRKSLHWLLLGISLALGLFDGFWNQAFFEYTGAIYWFSFCMSILFGFMLFTIAHFVAPKIIAMKPGFNKLSVLALVFGSLFLVFSYMANGRAQLAGASGSGVNLIISCGMFALSCYMSFLYHRKRREKSQPDTSRMEMLRQEHGALKKEIKRIDQELANMDKQEKEEREHARALFEYATGLRQRIIDEAYQAYFVYKKINRLNRTDGVLPPCLQYPDYPFSFTSFVDLSKEQPPFQKAGPIVAGLFALVVGLSSCTFTSPAPVVDATHIIVVDTTDPLLVYPDSTQLMHFIQLYANIWQGQEVHVSTITDKDVNPVQTFTLPKENRITGNLQRRQREVEVFSHQLDSVVALHVLKGNPAVGHSVIYRTLAQQLAVLRERTSIIRNLVVYSNLYENSDLANFYDAATLRQMKAHPQPLLQHFWDAAQLGDLTGITIWLVYRPVDYQDNLRYLTVSNFFKQLFTDHGATVHIVASL